MKPVPTVLGDAHVTSEVESGYPILEKESSWAARMQELSGALGMCLLAFVDCLAFVVTYRRLRNLRMLLDHLTL